MKTQTKTVIEEIDRIEAQTLDSIYKGQKNTVVKLYQKMEGIFISGNEYTKNLIANKFIYPISLLLEMNYSWGKEYLDLFPKSLKGEYRRQLYSSGI